MRKWFFAAIAVTIVVVAAVIMLVVFDRSICRVSLFDDVQVFFRSGKNEITALLGEPVRIDPPSDYQREVWHYENISLRGYLADVRFGFSNKSNKLVSFEAFIYVGTEQEAEAIRNSFEQFLDEQFQSNRWNERKALIPDGVSISVGAIRTVVYYLATGRSYGADDWYVDVSAEYWDSSVFGRIFD